MLSERKLIVVTERAKRLIPSRVKLERILLPILQQTRHIPNCHRCGMFRHKGPCFKAA